MLNLQSAGYLVMAFNKEDATKPIGTFKLPSNGQLINCNDGVMVIQSNVIQENLIF
jgi:hypothetical protein